MKKMLIIANPNSGKGKNEEIIPNIVKILSQKYDCTLVRTTKQGDGKILAQNAPDDTDVITCLGGDGTLSEVAFGISKRKKNVPIGYIPTGTTNDFAKGLGIPCDWEKAAERILQGKPQIIDLGMASKRSFVYIASFGIFTKTSYATSQKMKKALGHTAYVLSGLKELFPIRAQRVKVIADGVELEENFVFGCVSNTYSFGGLFNFTKASVSLSDGEFEVLLVKNCFNIFKLLSCLIAVSKHNYEHKNIVFFKTNSIEFITDSPMQWSLDGEHYEGQKDEIIKVEKQKISIIV